LVRSTEGELLWPVPSGDGVVILRMLILLVNIGVSVNRIHRLGVGIGQNSVEAMAGRGYLHQKRVIVSVRLVLPLIHLPDIRIRRHGKWPSRDPGSSSNWLIW